MAKGEIRVVALNSFKDPTGKGKDLNEYGYGVMLYPVNGGVFGEAALREGDELTGWGKLPLLEYFGDSYDISDAAATDKALERYGGYVMELGGKLWCFSSNHRDELLQGSRPAAQGGALINHAPQGYGANCTWVWRQSNKGTPYPTVKMTDNINLGDFFYFDYEGQRNSQYWKKHQMGKLPLEMPTGVDAVRSQSLLILMRDKRIIMR